VNIYLLKNFRKDNKSSDIAFCGKELEISTCKIIYYKE
jgi:hypothetical protein